jgi:hypothetical protein
MTGKIKQKIASETLTVLSFTHQEIRSLRWLKHNEFIFNDNMYDVVSMKTGENGKIIYHCINDTHEKKLLAHLDDHVNRHMQTDSRNQKNEQNFIKNLLKDYCPTKFSAPAEITGINCRFIPYNLTYLSVIPEQQVPPPKTIC